MEKKNEVSNQIAGRGDIDLSTTWMSNTIDWEYSSNLSLMSISSYIEYETGNIYQPFLHGQLVYYFVISIHWAARTAVKSNLADLEDQRWQMVNF